MAHFSSVNEGALISSINQCISALNRVNNGDLVSIANSLKAIGYETKNNIVSIAVSVSGSFDSLQSSLSQALTLANKISEYKAQKSKVDALKKQLDGLRAKISTIKSKATIAYNKYRNAKRNNSSDAHAHLRKYNSLKSNQAKEESKYKKLKKEYDVENEKLKKLANELTGMGFPPESN